MAGKNRATAFWEKEVGPGFVCLVRQAGRRTVEFWTPVRTASKFSRRPLGEWRDGRISWESGKMQGIDDPKIAAASAARSWEAGLAELLAADETLSE